MKYLLILIVCFFLIHLGTCKECYVCVSVVNGTQKCGDPFKKEEHVAEICADEKHLCLKEKRDSLADLPNNIQRGCADPEYCKEIGKKAQYCSTCDVDMCNSSNIPTQFITVGLIFMLTVFLGI